MGTGPDQQKDISTYYDKNQLDYSFDSYFCLRIHKYKRVIKIKITARRYKTQKHKAE